MATVNVGVPIQVLQEGEGHNVTIELKTGQSYRGKLVEVQADMNCLMNNATCTARDGSISKKESVFIRGSQIKYFVLPDLLRSAPILRKVQAVGAEAQAAAKTKGRGGGRKKKN